MKIVNLSNRLGEIKQKHVGYSFLFCLFGPFYLFAKARIFSGLFLLIIYYYLLPIPGIFEFSTFITKNLPPEYGDIISRFLVFFRGEYSQFVGIAIVIFFQIIVSFFVEGLLLRRSIRKKKFLPVTEDDARLLISIHACSRKVSLASSRNENETYLNDSIKTEIDVPYIINEVDNSRLGAFKRASMKRKLEELNELYRLEQMTREEYEVRRQLIIKEYKENKN